MRHIVIALSIAVLASSPAAACDFRADNGSTVRFAGTEHHPYAIINGTKCEFTSDTFTCNGRTTPYVENWDRFTWEGHEYVTTDNCAMVE